MQFSKKIQNKDIRTMTLVGPIKNSQGHKSSLIFNKENALILIDGGLSFVDDYQIETFENVFFIGDLDSINENHSEKLSLLNKDNIFKFNTDKDLSDLELALNFCAQNLHSLKKISIVNILDGRRDHHYGNLLTIQKFVDGVNFENFSVELDNEIIISKGILDFHHQGIFSIFTNYESTVSISGDAKYQLKDEKLNPQSSHGLSNVAQGNVTLTSSSPIITFLV